MIQTTVAQYRDDTDCPTALTCEIKVKKSKGLRDLQYCSIITYKYTRLRYCFDSTYCIAKIP